jgi:colanic acid/amylovoran biosynthesis glycosyltransferase
MNLAPPRLAYLASEYPAISHTFILREVRALRARNFSLRTASINALRRPEADLTGAEQEEAAATFYIKRAGITGALRAHARAIAKRPRAYFRGLKFALELGGSDLRELLYAVFYFVEAVILGAWMEDQGVPHLHVHFANPAATVGLIASRTFGVGFSFTVHGPDEFYDVRGQHLQEKIAGAAFVICIGSFARSQLMRLTPPFDWKKFVIAPLGVDPEIFRPRAARPLNHPFHLLCVGRLVPAKGQHILLAAIDRLTQAGREITLSLVGDGPDRASLEREVACRGLGNRVSFAGNVNQDRIGQYYEEADAFVLASFAEGIPVVLMEAMAMEIPCVSTMITGIPELIRNEIDGLLVMPSDDRALAQAIEKLMDDADLRRRLGEAGRQRVLANYNLPDNIELLARLFQTRLGRDCLATAQATPGEYR